MSIKDKRIKVRGTGCFNLSDNSFDFTPFNEGPSSQANVKSCKGGAKSWETIGKDPSRIISLKAKMSNPDKYAEFARQFHVLTKDLKPLQPIPLPDTQRVVNEDGLECWVDEGKGSLTFTGTINLSRHSRDWQAEVLRQVQLVVRRLPASEKFNKVINTIKKGGNEQ